MSEMQASADRVVWFDLPVADLARASRFYGALLGIKVHQEKAGNMNFAVLQHGPDGNGGCLIANAKDVSGAGILVYMRASARTGFAPSCSTAKATASRCIPTPTNRSRP